MKIVFSDIDNTIMFDLTVAPETLRLIRKVRERAPFALITARSLENMTEVPDIPHDRLILENGCVIHDGGRADETWDARIRPFLPLIEEQQRRLSLKTRSKTRTLSIGMTENRLTDEDAARIERDLPPELVVRRSTNPRGRFLEIYCVAGGKAAAVEYLAGTLGARMEETCCLGDDLVDLDMLEVCGLPITYEGAHAEVRDLVRRRGGHIAPGTGHDASRAMLLAVLAWLAGSPPTSS
jgi:hydroxymethylpyrimidine pyrophosphatase-like HAD family hydrolase